MNTQSAQDAREVALEGVQATIRDQDADFFTVAAMTACVAGMLWAALDWRIALAWAGAYALAYALGRQSFFFMSRRIAAGRTRAADVRLYDVLCALTVVGTFGLFVAPAALVWLLNDAPIARAFSMMLVCGAMQYASIHFNNHRAVFGTAVSIVFLHLVGLPASDLLLRPGQTGPITAIMLLLAPAYVGMVVATHLASERAKAELRRARREAEHSNAAKSRFIANMSHEIRTPMNGVLGMLQFLQSSDLDDAQRAQARTAETAARHLLSVLNNVLDISKLESGAVEVERIPFAPAALAEDVAAIFRYAAEAKGLALETAVGDAPEELAGDPTRLRQILANLVGNAVKFTETGTVRIRLSYDAQTQRLRMAVEDTGVGIEAQAIAGLFERFAQADASTTRKYGGSGLGLSISKELVDRLGGEISVQSEPGVGSRFDVTVPAPPAATPAEDSAPTPPAGAPEAGARLRVLIADDQPVNRHIVEAVLTKAGHVAVAVDNGAEAFEAACAEPFDVILMDVQMPVMDGLAATRAIRAAPPPTGATPIIALTANAMAEDRAACLKAGMDAYLAKPLDFEALLECVKGLARRPRLQPDEERSSDGGRMRETPAFSD